MRTSTILGISISLATGIIVGWSTSYFQPAPKPAPPSIKEPYYPTAIAYTTPHTAFPNSLGPVDGPVTPQINPKFDQIESLLSSSRPLEAIAALADISSSIDLSSPTGKEWLRLLIDAYADTDNKEQLIQIYSRFPSAFTSNEQAALAVADNLILQQNISDYLLLRAPWIGKESQRARWTFLDAQKQIIDGNSTEAVKILQASQFKGKDETDRLVRLAALFVADDPKRAWNYLTEAAKQDPANPDIRIFRASLAEMLNRSQTAHSDYIAAVQSDPENPIRREQLADFYLRTQQYPQAMTILQDTMTEPSSDSIWLKTLFWGKVAFPVKKTWKGAEIPDGATKEFVAYLNAIPEGFFWNESAFSQLPNTQYYLDNLQEAFWLQLISDLKKGNESQASERITQNAFAPISWAPELEKAIKTIISFRQERQSTSEALSLFPRASDIENPKELVQLLADLSNTPQDQLFTAIPLDLHDFLLSKEAFAIPFLAAEWNEAAIQLHALREFPSSFPGWIAASFTEALNQNRDTKTALDFATAQKPSPPLSLLVAKLALNNEDKVTAFNALKGIYTSNDTHGRKAALMLGQFLMDHNNPEDAKKALMAQPELANDTAAKELLARIAVQEDDIEKATAIYKTLESQSAEAKSFLARKAFADKKWTRARQLTEALLREFPENATLQDNLKKISVEEKKQPPPKNETVSAKF